MGGRRLVVVAEREHSYLDLDGRGMVSIGRSPDNDIVLKDDMVSRRHAQIEREADGALRVRDLKSFNGTYLNERRVRDEPLGLWDAVRVGRTKIFLVERVETAPGVGAAPAPAAPAAEAAAPAPAAADHEAEMGATKTLDVSAALASKELRGVVDDLIRRERESVEQQVVKRIRDESGPTLLASLAGFKVRVRRSGPVDGGGDFYDVFRDPLLPNDLFVALGSVSGVGIAACVAATATRHTTRGIACGRDLPPIELMGPLRDVLSQTLHPGSAVSLLLARLNGSGRVRIAFTGGTGALLYKSAQDEVEVLRAPGRRDEEAPRPAEVELLLKPDDRLVLASDGAGALRGPEGEAYGAERLQAKLKAEGKDPAKELLKLLASDYQAFAGPQPERDVTLVVLTQQAD